MLKKLKLSVALKQICTLFDEFALILNLLKRRDEIWENVAVKICLFPNLAASESEWEYPILTLHIVVFQNATFSSTYSSFVSHIQAAFQVKLPYFEPYC